MAEQKKNYFKRLLNVRIVCSCFGSLVEGVGGELKKKLRNHDVFVCSEIIVTKIDINSFN